MARPTKYSEEILTLTQTYIDSCGDGYEVVERPNVKDGIHTGTEQFRKEKIKIPTIEGLAYYIKVNKTTIYEWRKVQPEFSNLIDEMLDLQASMLINGGIAGTYSPVISKVLLTKHGYREGIEQTGKDGKDLIPDKEAKENVDKALNSFLNDSTGNPTK